MSSLKTLWGDVSVCVYVCVHVFMCMYTCSHLLKVNKFGHLYTELLCPSLSRGGLEMVREMPIFFAIFFKIF